MVVKSCVLQQQLSSMDLMNSLLKVGCRDLEVHVETYITYQFHFHHSLLDPHQKNPSLTNATMDVNNQIDQQHHNQNGDQSGVALHDHLQVRPVEIQVNISVTEAADLLREIGDQIWEEHCNAASPSKAQILIDYIPSLMSFGVAALTIYQCCH